MGRFFGRGATLFTIFNIIVKKSCRQEATNKDQSCTVVMGKFPLADWSQLQLLVSSWNSKMNNTFLKKNPCFTLPDQYSTSSALRKAQLSKSLNLTKWLFFLFLQQWGSKSFSTLIPKEQSPSGAPSLSRCLSCVTRIMALLKLSWRASDLSKVFLLLLL